VKKIDEYMPAVEVALFSPSRDRILLPHILKGPNLRWIQQIAAGVDWLMNYPKVVESDLILTSASGIHAIPVSEHILALMLNLARDIQRSLRDQIKHNWNRDHSVTEIEGSVMGLIGVGRIGEKVAEKAKRLNMRVLGIRRNPERASPWVDQMSGPESLLEMLAQADFVVITAPLTPETRGMIGERELKAMKKSACLINSARGSVIQEEALRDALREGWIAGAGLDVFEDEPLPQNSPFWDMSNVIITAHYSWTSPKNNDRLVELFTENLRRYRLGEPLINRLDKRRGY
jgi:phosphoglycerate dehydrogenase-like enzyme